jgi:hypothetical protein
LPHSSLGSVSNDEARLTAKHPCAMRPCFKPPAGARSRDMALGPKAQDC